MHLVKYINHFTNQSISYEQDARSLYNCMVYKDDPIRTLKVFEAFEIIVKNEMAVYEKKSSEICRAVNSKWTPEPMKLERKPYVYDPNFDKSLAELEVKY